MEIYPKLQAKGVGLVAVGSGTPFMAADFANQFRFTGDLYVDQSRAVYEAFNCKRGLKYAINMRVLKAAKDAMSQGHSQGSTQGDSLQLGGTFVISKTQGVIYEHLEQFAGDHADLNEVLSVLPN